MSLTHVLKPHASTPSLFPSLVLVMSGCRWDVYSRMKKPCEESFNAWGDAQQSLFYLFVILYALYGNIIILFTLIAIFVCFCSILYVFILRVIYEYVQGFAYSKCLCDCACVVFLSVAFLIANIALVEPTSPFLFTEIARSIIFKVRFVITEEYFVNPRS